MKMINEMKKMYNCNNEKWNDEVIMIIVMNDNINDNDKM